MPILTPIDIWRPSQVEFAEIAYGVMGVIFEVHQELGRLLTEEIFHLEIASRLPGSKVKLPIKVMIDDFSKPYYLDMLVADGVPIELKAVDVLAPRHRAQLLHYQMLLEVAHSKLVNLRSESVQHEFINTNLMRTDRITFDVVEDGWESVSHSGRRLKPWFEALMRDVGVGLDQYFYVDAVTHFFGGEDRVFGETPVTVRGRRLGAQRVRFAAPDTIFKISMLPDNSCRLFEDHARRLLDQTTLKRMLWINLNLKTVRFRTIRRSS